MATTDDDRRTHDVVQIDTKTGKWRYQCPREHAEWYVINGVLKCRTCERHASNGADVEPTFKRVLDTKTGERIPRERIEVVPRPHEIIR